MILVLSSKLSTPVTVGSLVMVILSAAIPIYMASSKDLDRYFSYKRQISCQ
jgi:hypothetical protein